MKRNFDNLLINKTLTIKQAMQAMDKTSHKVLFVIDSHNKLIGAVTDGDVRRWILKDGDLNASVDNIYNKKPLYFDKDYDIEEVKEKMIETKIQWIPIVNKTKTIADILFWEDVFAEKFVNSSVKMNIPVVIMAGGKGTRLEPFTKILPKPLIPVGDKPILELIMDNFSKYSVKDFYLTVNYKGDMIKSYFDHSNTDYKIKYVWEDKPLGTAGGLKLLPKFKAQDFFLTNCDVIIRSEYDSILEFHKKNDYDLTIVASMQHFKIPYGVLAVKDGGKLLEIKEKPEYDFLVNTGMYIMKTKMIDEIPEDEFFHMTDLIDILREKDYKIGIYPISQNSWLDIGQWGEYQNTVKELGIG